MCIVFFTTAHRGYRLILASNRDEFLDRPALPAQWHDFDGKAAADVLSGRDLGASQAGTWIGMTRDLRVGVVTNIRTNDPPRPNPPSRGALLRDYLRSRPGTSAETFLRQHLDDSDRYEGFNLLLFNLDADEAFCLCNRPEPRLDELKHHDGQACGLSNSPLDQPWPKVTEGQRRMRESLDEWLGDNEEDLVEKMFDLLSQMNPVSVPEDAITSARINPVQFKQRWYATRVSTVILVKDGGDVTFVERDIYAEDEEGWRPGSDQRTFRWTAS